ncbi:hypothetical protein M5K25_000516 [Dendrobium thyrsiflorum]|uniref:Uncharacterized protein n=1 Tax=Dendrobium thyrsiflorum TaxID=117978 RepID=A0ABD0W8J3_DENTH
MDFLIANDYHDIGSIGPKFTWCNNKEGLAHISERLDRVCLNSKALCCITFAVVKHMPRVASDHCPLIINLFNFKLYNHKSIRFENIWCSYEASRGVVMKAWRKKDFGSAADILQRKVRESLRRLLLWSKNKLRELNKSKGDLLNEISGLQEEESVVGLNPNKLLLLRKKVHELNITLIRLSMRWRQHSKN